VDLTGRAAASLLDEAGLAPGTVRQVADLPRARNLLDQLVEVGSGPPRLRQRRCDALCEFLILSLGADALPYGSHQSRAYLTFVRCREFVREHYLELASLAEIADACRIDQAYLCRQFRRFAGETPYTYLLRLKTDHAAYRLRTSNCLIKEVADELGFANPYHFSRVFKRVHGCSPDVFLRHARRHTGKLPETDAATR
jgi:AraC-like DNA-binding protein